MSTFDLTTLSGWVRRAGGDIVTTERDEFTSEGELSYSLTNEGAANVLSVLLDDDPLTLTTDYTVSGTVVSLVDAPAVNSVIVVNYESSRYSDDELYDFITDAARKVASELPAPWSINSSTHVITDATDAFFTDGVFSPDAELLIVLATAMAMYSDKSNEAADDAIKIRDGDTAIDTDATSRNIDRVLDRTAARYDKTLNLIKARLFKGDNIIC